MAETLINNNQIDTANTDKITVAVCNKVFEDLNNTLIQKGVPSDSISADNPTGLVDAVKALPTNTMGSLNKDYPIALLDGDNYINDNYNFYYDIIDTSILRYMVQNGNSCYFYDLSTKSFPTEDSFTVSVSPDLTVNKTLVQNSITEQALGYTLGNNIVLKCIDNSINLAYVSYVNSTTAYCGIITVNKEDWSTITATCMPITFSEDSYTNTFGSSMFINAAKDNKAVINTKVSNAWGILDLQTGILKTELTSFASILNDYGAYQAKSHNGLYTFQNGRNLALLNIDWNNFGNSQMKLQTSYSNPCVYGVSQDNSKFYMLCYDRLDIYNVSTGNLKTIPLSSDPSDNFLYTPNNDWYPNSGNCRECVYVEQNDILTYLYFGGGIIILDTNDEIVKPVSGAKAISFKVLKDKNFYGNIYFSNNVKIRLKYNNVIYEFNGSVFSYIKTYKNKVLFNFYIRNEQELYYFYNKIITKEKMDSTLFDADTVSISVDVRDVSSAQEASV